MNNKDMIGTWNKANVMATFPTFNIAGRVYQRPASTFNLPNGKFCVLASGLDIDIRNKRIQELTEYAKSTGTKKVSK